MATHTPSYQMHTKVPVRHTRGKHLVALVGVPLIVLSTVLVVWNALKEQCAVLSTAQCLPVGSTDLGGTEVAVLATLLAAGLATIVEVAAD
ncbi:hypothetical protein GCM10009623_29690 [Nocardioides aestuarii]|uniref:Uncharacterized protein n=1 Tax=Nocardioides aestuarii TaxID=252231 RepID=A0ABW4TQ88_9ACTN